MIKMESAFLSKEDMIRLTDYKLPSKQIEVLRKNGIPFTVDRSGHPVVMRTSLSDVGKASGQIEPEWKKATA